MATSAAIVLRYLLTNRVVCSVVGGKLRVRIPLAIHTKELEDAIRCNREAIVSVLNACGGALWDISPRLAATWSAERMRCLERGLTEADASASARLVVKGIVARYLDNRLVRDVLSVFPGSEVVDVRAAAAKAKTPVAAQMSSVQLKGV